jgi:hypothetical protein
VNRRSTHLNERHGRRKKEKLRRSKELAKNREQRTEVRDQKLHGVKSIIGSTAAIIRSRSLPANGTATKDAHDDHLRCRGFFAVSS